MLPGQEQTLNPTKILANPYSNPPRQRRSSRTCCSALFSTRCGAIAGASPGTAEAVGGVQSSSGRMRRRARGGVWSSPGTRPPVPMSSRTGTLAGAPSQADRASAATRLGQKTRPHRLGGLPCPQQNDPLGFNVAMGGSWGPRACLSMHPPRGGGAHMHSLSYTHTNTPNGR